MPNQTLCELPHREPKATHRGRVCDHHHRWIGYTLTDIAETSALLPHFIEPGTALDDGRQVHGKRVDPPAPLRLDVVALNDRRTIARFPGDLIPVLAILETWAQLVRDTRQLQTPTQPVTILRETATLHRNLDWLITQEWIADLATELRDIKAALHSAIGDHAPRPVGVCPIHHPDTGECGGKLYQDRYGGMSVTCRKCGETWGETELRRLGLMTTAI